jgi:hypothetical protein
MHLHLNNDVSYVVIVIQSSKELSDERDIRRDGPQKRATKNRGRKSSERKRVGKRTINYR